MGALPPLDIERACTRLVHQYALRADARDAAGAAALFAADAVLEMPTGRFAGRDAIQRRLQDQPADQVSRHYIANVLIEAIDADRARGTCYMALYRGAARADGKPIGSEVPFVLGQYEDQYVRGTDGWVFAGRRLTYAFRRQ